MLPNFGVGDITGAVLETIPKMLEKQAETLAGRPAIVDGTTTLSFVDLAERVDEAARALIAAGIQKGDRIAIWSPNSWEWIVCALAIHSVGAVLVPVNTRYKGMEAAYLLEKSGARALFTVTGFLDVDYVELLREAGADLPQLEQIIVLRGDAPGGTLGYDAFLALASNAPSNAAKDRASDSTAR